MLGNPQPGKRRQILWTVPSSAKSIKKGDVICLLQGAQKPTIVRLCKDYFTIIKIAIVPPENIQKEWTYHLQLEEFFNRDFLLIWDWVKSLENLQDSGIYDTLIRKLPKLDLEGQLNSATGLWNLAQILGDSGQYEEAREKEQRAIEVYKETIREGHLRTIESQYGLIPLLLAARMGNNQVVAKLLNTGQANIDLMDWNDRTPLSWATRNGHEAIVKLLLETSKVDVESKDTNYGQTPLSWAAGNGHEAIVKLLLETSKVDVESKGSSSQTPLSWAAGNGHEAIVKLLQS